MFESSWRQQPVGGRGVSGPPGRAFLMEYVSGRSGARDAQDSVGKLRSKTGRSAAARRRD